MERLQCAANVAAICIVCAIAQAAGDKSAELRQAVRAGDVVKVRTILNADGINVNSKDNYGQTALHIAASRGLAEIVKLLITKGADPDIKDRAGKTPLILAEGKGHKEVAELLQKRIQFVSLRTIQGMGFLVAGRLDSHYKPAPSPGKKYVVIFVMAPADLFKMTDAEYAEYASSGNLPGIRPFPHVQIRKYEAKRFALVRPDGSKTQGIQLSVDARDFATAITGPLAVTGDMAIAFELDASECVPPFQIQLDDSPAVSVPDNPMKLPEGRSPKKKIGNR
jgi:hypothetical protein